PRRHAERACYNEHRGLTLVELLVVIVILTMVTAATIPLMAPVTGERKVRESARLLSSVFAQAQSRALTTGRPAGVWIQRLANGPTDFIDRANQAVDLFLCESPPPYSGETPYTLATVAADSSNFVVEIQGGLPQGYVFTGDRIRFNYRGAVYRIAGVGPKVNVQSTYGDGSLTGANMAINVLPTDIPPPLTAPVPFQIFRQPVKTADEPVTFPVGAMIDLGFSGVGNGMEFAVPLAAAAASSNTPSAAATGVPHSPVLIMFGPSGNLDSVYFGHRPSNRSTPQFEAYKPITAVYLLVGQRNADDAVAVPNFMNQQNVWAAINPQSGLVTTSEVAIGTDDDVSTMDWSNPTQVQQLLSASRAFARSAQNMGGR
ncbi:MAG: prepilin-type N-terminal cleavage/methylation domain-containing protein, partial [Pirellulales bacterium]